MIIENSKYSENLFHNAALFVFAIGYEQRSSYLYDKISSSLKSFNAMIFTFDDYLKHNYSEQKMKEINRENIKIFEKNYSDSQNVQMEIIKEIENLVNLNDSITVHIDYSSMPRSWYCKLPILLERILRKEDKIYFWYSEGKYLVNDYEEFPCAGIEDFSFFSGKPSLQIDRNRIHILALGYDNTRSQAIISITDPDYLVTCCAYNPDQKDVLDKIHDNNQHILSRAAMSFTLQLDDFSFMLSKLRGTVNELLPTGNVVLIPDGPKPLIFAISLVPDLLNKEGLTCLHIARNSKHFTAVDVTATGEIYGFSIQIEC
jgi:hypothetical protein